MLNRGLVILVQPAHCQSANLTQLCFESFETCRFNVFCQFMTLLEEELKWRCFLSWSWLLFLKNYDPKSSQIKTFALFCLWWQVWGIWRRVSWAVLLCKILGSNSWVSFGAMVTWRSQDWIGWPILAEDSSFWVGPSLGLSTRVLTPGFSSAAGSGTLISQVTAWKAFLYARWKSHGSTCVVFYWFKQSRAHSHSGGGIRDAFSWWEWGSRSATRRWWQTAACWEACRTFSSSF